ncbi:MAG TPA: 5-methyltetrahydropteroyltriglutamate--homocysteine S-methyltransferase [Streptosporangiaceae bacterium]|jgi:5-methyltetrahydropteroyltriglutamate--homocysteine methyltransferase|nr:5-methyltetrahydropteroyltriglutamate--homocysteine S-methyltransferase [Streptosporangiaceae bacterium]
MSVRTSPPFRADHVGSLLRPPALRQAREDAARGVISPDDLRAAEDEAIREAVAMQQDVGLRSVTDGEFRRASWHMDFIYEIAGVQKADQRFKSVFHNESGDIEFTPAGVRITGKLGTDHTIFGSAFSYLRDIATTATPKLTIPAPSLVHYRGGPAAIDKSVYPDMDGFWDDLGAAYADEIRRLADIGCTYLQLDDTSLAYLNDPAQRGEIARRGEDAEHQHETYIKAINRALRDRPAGMTVTTHMCRGNYRSSWVAQGGYDFVADALFNELNVDGYFMEYDDQRSGGFEPLRFVPKGKVVVLGLITSKKPDLEAKDDIKRRIEQASKFVDIDQLCLSPQCGFSSTLEGNALSADQQIAKLRLVVETADEVWGGDS